MPKFITFKSPTQKELKENPLKALWESFQSLDSFTKGFLVVILLLILSTPFIINNLQIFKPHAQEQPPTLGEQTPQQPESVPDEILLKFKSGVSDKAKENIRKAHGLEKKDEIEQIGVERGKVPEKAKDKIIEALSHNPRVEYAEPNFIAKAEDSPDDPEYVTGRQWTINKLSLPQAWDISMGNSSSVVAVLDTGTTNVPDLQGKLLTGFNYWTNTTDTTDDAPSSHGTAVSGIVGANTNNSIGVAGVCRLCPILPVKVMDSSGSGDYGTISKGIIFAADHGAKAINMSLGGSSSDTTMQNAINYAWSKGVVVVASSGNSGTAPIYYPAFAQNVIAVGGTDSNDNKWSGSSFGTGLDVMAPGVGARTTFSTGTYGGFSGTSAASPFVAALAGLIMSANPGLTNQQVVDIITSTADKITGGCNGYDSNGWSQYCGFGRMNAYQALSQATGITITPDTEKPTITLTKAPTSGQTISGIIDAAADATDNVGVVRVTFAIQDSTSHNLLSSNDYSSPYQASFDTSSLISGQQYYLKAVAADNAGNLTTAATYFYVTSSTTDTTTPTVSIGTPTDGASVSGNTNIIASASDNVTVSSISIFVDSAVVTSCAVSGTNTSCSYSLDATQYANGSHTISAKALDSSNNLGTSSTNTVNVTTSSPTSTPTPTQSVSTPTPTLVPPTPSATIPPSPTPTKVPVSSDTTPPTISITSPLSGTTVAKNSTITITASPSDNIGITKVEFYVSGSLTPKCSDTTPPYTCSSWKVPGKAGATYTITAKAYDPSGNTGTASVVVRSK